MTKEAYPPHSPIAGKRQTTKKNVSLEQAAGVMLRDLRPSARKAGLPPGTPVHVGAQGEQDITITIVDYDADTYNSAVLRPSKTMDFSVYRQSPTISWINIDGLYRVDVIEKICNDFLVHPMVQEDILNTTHRPKVDVADDYVFIVLKTHSVAAQANRVGLDLEQVSFLLGANFLITFQERRSAVFDQVHKRLVDSKSRLRKMGPDYLAYALTDAIIDNFFMTLEQIGEEIESLEEQLVTNPSAEPLQRIHVLKRKIILLRKSVWPLREVISALQRDDLPLISPSIAIYLKDLYDHTIHIIDTVETFRDVIASMLDIYLSSISIRMNEVMKVLTMFTAIFIPLTLIAGIYGMNFNSGASPWNMPELSWYWGYPFALGLMACLGIGMVIYFKKKKWF